MSKLREKPISTLEGLLERMYTEWESNKFSAVLHYLGPGESIWVAEAYEHRHMSTSEDDTDVAEPVFLEALNNGYICGILRPGYISRIHFQITELGEKKYLQLKAERLSKEITEAENRL